MPLIDLHVDWTLQYAGESTTFDADLYPGVASRVGQAVGYLQTTRAAIVSCYRRADDWARQPDPWAALASLIARIEAEFSGRLLIGPEDWARWDDDRDGLTWGMIGVEGFDALVRSPDDLAHLPRLFDRGVRLFQPTYNETGLLAGSAAPGDDRGLLPLGVRFLEALLEVAPSGSGPRPIVDLAHLNPTSMADVLGWFESDAARSDRLILAYSHGALAREGYEAPRALTRDNLVRLRALGGTIGLGVSPPFYSDPDQIRADVEAIAAVPFAGRTGAEGIAIGTDFLGVDRTLPGLGTAPEVVEWAGSRFDPATATALLQGSARALLARSAGVA
ncbi:membrane dipeptidase [Tundrisphaera sp. TA3]|uniref:membrane dipeptidase n=1 Tax=Tundrisphaera sp. TA3 TaxID=3435775 RepID=UPI003EBCAEFA